MLLPRPARGGDELNLVLADTNYGWPFVTLGTDYPTYSWSLNADTGRHASFERPVFAWVPSVGISALVQIGNFNARWNGDLLAGSLKASSLYRIRLIEGRVLYSEPIWLGARVRDLDQVENGTLVVWTDDGDLLLITVDEVTLSADIYSAATPYPWQLIGCLKCHHFDVTTETHVAPSLKDILGRPIASDPNFGRYSPSMKSTAGLWTEENLKLFLADPSSYVPGTSMAIAPITNDAELSRIIQGLKNAG